MNTVLLPHQKAKILWNCRRGMLELDLILARFVEKHLDALNSEQISDFETLLQCPDPDLYAWFMGYEQPTDSKLNEIINYIRKYDTLK